MTRVSWDQDGIQKVHWHFQKIKLMFMPGWLCTRNSRFGLNTAQSMPHENSVLTSWHFSVLLLKYLPYSVSCYTSLSPNSEYACCDFLVSFCIWSFALTLVPDNQCHFCNYITLPPYSSMIQALPITTRSLVTRTPYSVQFSLPHGPLYLCSSPPAPQAKLIETSLMLRLHCQWPIYYSHLHIFQVS